MPPRWIVVLGLLVAFGDVFSLVARQSREHTSPRRAERSSQAKTSTLPRTVWGEPDLSGVYGNDEESGTPFERPNELSGRRIEDITPRELAEMNRERASRFNATLAGFGSTLFPGTSERKNSRPWLVVDPPDGHVPPLTEEAQERLRHPPRGRSSNSIPDGPFDGYEDLGLYDRCITRGVPESMIPVGYGGNYEIIQSKDQVAIRYEMIHEVRVIPLDGRPRVGKNLRLDLGDGRGRWDANSLVVESTNFSSRSAFRGATEDLRLTERFTPSDPAHLEWRVTVDDGRTWTRPWSFVMTLTRRDPSQRIYEYGCHEGNYGLRNILTGARSADQVRQER